VNFRVSWQASLDLKRLCQITPWRFKQKRMTRPLSR